MAIRRRRYAVRFAASPADLSAIETLRSLCFRNGRRGDFDTFDQRCRHVMVIDRRQGRLAACFRLLPLAHGGRIAESYASHHYELSALAAFEGPLVEVGRLCVHPDCRHPDVLRMAWAALVRFVDEQEIRLLFGCTSFAGTDADLYRDSFALLYERHLAPQGLRPRAKAAHIVRFARKLPSLGTDFANALKAMPPLLRSYLAMGGWVSDHAVIDRDLDTLHVFTALEVGRIPRHRLHLLRADSRRVFNIL